MEIERLKAQVREVELKVRLRDDLILELKRSLEEQRRLTAATELALRTQQAQQAKQAESVRAPAQDDLKQIRGVGPAFERKLHALSVTTFAQIAAWTQADIDRISTELAILPTRIARDGWIESAKAKLR